MSQLRSDGSLDGQAGGLDRQEVVAKGAHILAIPKGTTRLESTQVEWFSWYSGKEAKPHEW